MFSVKPKVELTKIHYYVDDKNIVIPTVSREVFQNTYNDNVVIKRNVFGHTWILKVNQVNETDPKKRKCSQKLIVCLWLFCCVLIAILFGIYFSFDRNIPLKHQNFESTIENLTQPSITLKPSINFVNITSTERTNVGVDADVKNETLNLIKICSNCSADEICMKTIEFHFPVCVKTKDSRDPSGCGGLCELNVQKCKKLHRRIDVFQCVKNEYAFRCANENDEFNCGSSCVSRTKRCDGTVDCFNMADEYDCVCNMDYYFHCGNGTSCIEMTRRCDGVFDCWDGYDELNCPSRDCVDENNKYPCVNGQQCIAKEQYCDGVYDCNDRSDEPHGCKY